MTLRSLRIADDPNLWQSVGFALTDDRCVIGGVELELVGASDARTESESAILGWTLDGEWPGEIDGIPTTSQVASEPIRQGAASPNGAVSLDHLVISTPDLDRTIDALIGAGFELRRIREIGRGMRQAFFWAGDVILEIVGPQGDPGPSRLWGLAFNTADLNATAAFLGDCCTTPKDAVQRGRRIASLTRECGVAVPIAFMTPHTSSSPG